jgi:hypothetical protein
MCNSLVLVTWLDLYHKHRVEWRHVHEPVLNEIVFKWLKLSDPFRFRYKKVLEPARLNAVSSQSQSNIQGCLHSNIDFSYSFPSSINRSPFYFSFSCIIIHCQRHITACGDVAYLSWKMAGKESVGCIETQPASVLLTLRNHHRAPAG